MQASVEVSSEEDLSDREWLASYSACYQLVDFVFFNLNVMPDYFRYDSLLNMIDRDDKTEEKFSVFALFNFTWITFGSTNLGLVTISLMN